MRLLLGIVGILVGTVGFGVSCISQNNLHTIIGVQIMCLGAIFFVGGAIVEAIRLIKEK